MEILQFENWILMSVVTAGGIVLWALIKQRFHGIDSRIGKAENEIKDLHSLRTDLAEIKTELRFIREHLFKK